MPANATTALATAMEEDHAGDSHRSIESSTRTQPPEPFFIAGPLPDHIKPALFAASDLPEVGCYTLHDVQVSFDGILIRRGRILHATDLNNPSEHAGPAILHHLPAWRTTPARQISGMAALLHGPGFDIYGHWLIDFLPRLWVLRRLGFDIHTLSFIMPRDLPDFAMTLLANCGITPDQYVFYDQKTELLQVETLLAPSLLRCGNRFSPLLPSATQYLLSLMRLPGLPSTPPRHRRKIYVTRNRHPGNRHLRSSESVESMALKMGYALVAPEHLTPHQQIALFAGATHIAGEYGSGLHNSIFAPPGTRICALRGTSHHPGFAQSGLAEVCNHHIAYLFGETPENAHDQIMDIPPGLAATALYQLET